MINMTASLGIGRHIYLSKWTTAIWPVSLVKYTILRVSLFRPLH